MDIKRVSYPLIYTCWRQWCMQWLLSGTSGVHSPPLSSGNHSTSHAVSSPPPGPLPWGSRKEAGGIIIMGSILSPKETIADKTTSLIPTPSQIDHSYKVISLVDQILLHSYLSVWSVWKLGLACNDCKACKDHDHTLYLSLTHWCLALVSATKSLGSTSSKPGTLSYSLGHLEPDIWLREGRSLSVL